MPRLYYVQWLRVFLIVLVVAHHAGQPYGPTGGEWPVEDPADAEWLGPFFAVNAAFFMGFFFLISGYFVADSFDRKGAAAFTRDRLIRLGVPLLVVALVVFPALIYAWQRPAADFLSFYVGQYVGRWQIEMGHLWFVAQLLAFSLLYVLFRLWQGRRGVRRGPPLNVPGDGTILAYALALAVVGALVRTRYPQDRWVDVLWLVPAEPAHLPQYVSLFAIGIVAGRGAWFAKLPDAVGRRWFAVGLAAFVLAMAMYAFRDRLAAVLDVQVAWGGFEAFVCVGLIVGLLVLFRRRFAAPSPWLSRLDANVYGVYIVHWFVVVALQAAILGLAWPATAKFLAVTVAGTAASFALAALLRTIPGVARVL
jgi:peptidoglycan/LPS O-acetylase OafA/YrhL